MKADDDMMINVLQLRKNIDTLGSMGIPFAAGLGHFEKVSNLANVPISAKRYNLHDRKKSRVDAV